MEFHWLDYVVLAAFLAISTAIAGVVACQRRKEQSSAEYLLGARQLPLLPVAISIWVTLMSAVSVLGTPLEVYLNGAGFLGLALSFIISVPIVAHVFVPFFYRLGLASVYEYLELRFSRTIRLLGAIVFCLQMVFYMAIVLYGPSLALSHVSNLPMWVSILATGLVCTLYTALGGLRAVVYTDTFQALVIVAGVLTLVVTGVLEVGGPYEVWRIAQAGGRLDNVLDFSLDPRVRHTVWSLTVGGATTTLSLYAINQMLVQRYVSVRKLAHAQATVYLNMPANMLSIAMFVGLGLVAYARYFQCDPFILKRIQAFDQLIPLMVMDVLGRYPGVPGLFLACIFSASLSTVSSGVNALALVYMEDGVKPAYSAFTVKDMSEHTAVLVTKVLALLFGLLTVGLAYLAAWMDQTLVSITLRTQGMTGGPLLGLFLLAIFCPSANSWGAGVGLLCGLAFSFWLGVGAILHGPLPAILPLLSGNCSTSMTSLDAYNVTAALRYQSSAANYTMPAKTPTSSVLRPYEGFWLYELSYLWYTLVTAVIVVTIGLIVSYLTGRTNESEINPDHVIPVWRKLKKFVLSHQERYEVWKSQKKQNVCGAPVQKTKCAFEDKGIPYSEKKC